MRRIIIAVSILVILTVFGGNPVWAGDMPPSATDHAALAKMYSAEAKALREKVAEHELMLHRYEKAATPAKGAPFPKAALVQHCRKLVASYKEAASNAEALAKAEAELAQAKATDK